MFFVYKYSDQFSLFKLSYFMRDSNARDNTELMNKMVILILLVIFKTFLRIVSYNCHTGSSKFHLQHLLHGVLPFRFASSKLTCLISALQFPKPLQFLFL